MQQASTPLTIYARSHSDPGSRQWLSMIGLSLIAHAAIFFWLSSQRPDFPDVKLSEFEVGLVASEGIGQVLQASQVATTVSEVTGILPEAVAEKTPLEQLTELSPIISGESSVKQPLQNDMEPVIVVSSDSPDLLSAQSQESPDKNRNEASTPTDIVEIKVTPAVAIESELTEAGIAGSEVNDVPLVNEFFQPAAIISDDPVASLPIEEVSRVGAPEEEATLQNNPALAQDSVEILEIKAIDVLPRQTAAAAGDSERSGQGLSQNNTLSVAGTNAISLGQAGAEKNKQLLVIPRTYILSLKEWLSQYKQYPPEAYRLGQEGVAIIALNIDRAGKVLSYTIKRSSGFPLLDQAVEKMIDSATNMPALPDSFPRDSLKLLVPVKFKVN